MPGAAPNIIGAAKSGCLHASTSTLVVLTGAQRHSVFFFGFGSRFAVALATGSLSRMHESDIFAGPAASASESFLPSSVAVPVYCVVLPFLYSTRRNAPPFACWSVHVSSRSGL